jgi:DNA polymerase-1
LATKVLDHEIALVKERRPQLMAGVTQLKVPLVADVGCGANWEVAH